MSLSPKHTYRDSAFVVRTQQLGDADKIVILLCEKYGLIHAVAKGARKAKSKFGARLEPFMLLDVGFVYKEKLSLLNQTVTKKAYAMPLMSRYESYIIGSLLNEITEKFAKFSEYDTYFFKLLHGALSSLSRQQHDSVDIANAFMLRLLIFTGWTFDIQNFENRQDFTPDELGKAVRYSDALVDSDWDIITNEDFGTLPLVIFSRVTTHIREVLDLELVSLPLIQKEFFGGR